tara:strand:+ start:4448 stop:5365 length:918 start_codon:yes stop_codon:yes gene_type:complete
MLQILLYYCLVRPLSLLPLSVGYVLTDLFYLLLISFAPYRSKVILGNISRSFPELSIKEQKKIQRKFYRHFCDILAEGIKNISLSEEDYRKRFKVVNPELIEKLYANKQSVILVSGHYNNWEWLVTAQSILFPHQAYGIGMPLTSKFWDKKINEKRSRLGMKVVNAKNYKESLNNTELKSVLVLSDQSPSDSKKSYWMNFLNQKTAVLFGAEIMAHQLNYAVVYFSTHKVKRGHYEMELKLITDNPSDMNWGEITEAHTRYLEEEIKNKPEYWLWSHKRWKRDVPYDIDALSEKQKQFFNEKFNK